MGITNTKDKIEGAASFRIKTKEFYIPMEETIDEGEEIKRLESELEYTKGFLVGVIQKLANQNFVKNAPEQVIKKEYQKKDDAEEKIRLLIERLESLKNE